ncbi:MAG: tetratricopeptide repeat protein [Candidatus Hydrogenedentes bacterium]|nr:tetratricopeptide repeat protein [Candidatus Hydrogenedentota bacterium]
MHRRIRLQAALLPLAVALVSTTATAELNLWISYHFQGMKNYRTGDYQDSEKLLVAALDETSAKFRRGDTLDALGQVYTALGVFEKAEQYYQDALNTKQKALGGRHRDVPITLNNLADLHYIQGKTEDVESLYRRALDINERDQLNLEVCRSLNGLALLQNDAGEYVKAEEHLKRAIEIHEKAQRRDHPYMATVLVNLGILYTNLGRYEEAQPLFERAQYIQNVALRPDHPDVAVRLHAMAALYQATGRTELANDLARRAEEIRQKQAAKGDLY